MVQRKPVNQTLTNPMGYVSITCRGVVYLPKYVKSAPPKQPKSVMRAIKEKYAERLLAWQKEPPKLINESHICNYVCAIQPGVIAHCPKCKSPLHVPVEQPKPFEDRAFRNAFDQYVAKMLARDKAIKVHYK